MGSKDSPPAKAQGRTLNSCSAQAAIAGVNVVSEGVTTRTGSRAHLCAEGHGLDARGPGLRGRVCPPADTGSSRLPWPNVWQAPCHALYVQPHFISQHPSSQPGTADPARQVNEGPEVTGVVGCGGRGACSDLGRPPHGSRGRCTAWCCWEWHTEGQREDEAGSEVSSHAATSAHSPTAANLDVGLSGSRPAARPEENHRVIESLKERAGKSVSVPRHGRNPSLRPLLRELV